MRKVNMQYVNLKKNFFSVPVELNKKENVQYLLSFQNFNPPHFVQLRPDRKNILGIGIFKSFGIFQPSHQD